MINHSSDPSLMDHIAISFLPENLMTKDNSVFEVHFSVVQLRNKSS